MQVAGAKDGRSLFPAETIAAVYRHSKGIPRLINTLCDNALITAYARRLPSVPPEIVDSTAADLRLDVVQLPPADLDVDFDETFARRASKTLLDFFSYLRRAPASDAEHERS